MIKRLIAGAFLLAISAFPQPKYTGPKPPKQDLPYLVHGDTLVALEANTATSQDRKDDTLYTIPGGGSGAKTPMASPIFVIDAAKIDVNKLQLFKLDSKGSQREVSFRKKGKGGAQPLPLSVSVVNGSVFRVEVVPSLENGEYSLSPDGTNQVFCFTVF